MRVFCINEEIFRSVRGFGAEGLSFAGKSFTWRGGLNNQSHSRLGRFLVTDNWDNLFNGSMQGVLPRSISDHFPIFLEEGDMKKRLSPFRFENMWLEEEEFKDQMKMWWRI